MTAPRARHRVITLRAFAACGPAHSNHGELNLARACADASGRNTLAGPAQRDSTGSQLDQQLMRGAVKVIRTGVTS